MAKRTTMDDRIKNLLKEGPLVGLYFSTAIILFKEKLDTMTDQEITEMFENLLNAQRVRDNVEDMYNKLNFPKDE